MPSDQLVECGTVSGHRRHLLRAEEICAACQDAVEVAKLERSLTGMSWQSQRVMLSVLIAKRPDLATLP